MKSLLMPICITVVVVLAFIAICFLGFIDMGVIFIIPCVMVASLFFTCLLFVWDDEAVTLWHQHLLTCDSVLPSNI